MAITVYKFPQPYLELELVAGGSLPINDYYFLGWWQRYGGYYHCASGPVSEEQSITTTTGYQSIKCSWWINHSDITQFSDGGSGQVIVTSVGHGLNENDSVKIIKTTNYNGTFTATNITDDTFEITTTWVSDDATGTWLNDNSIPDEVKEGVNNSGISFKWDNYSMINSSTGKPYKWLNMNDPNNYGKDEFDETYGHRKWTQYYSSISYTSGGYQIFTSYATGTGNSVLKDGIIQGTNYSGRGGENIQVAHRNKVVYLGWKMDDRFSNLDAKLHIRIDDTDTNNNWDDFVAALVNSGYDDNFILYYKDAYCIGMDLIGSYDGPGVGTWTNISLNSSGGWRCDNIVYDNCQIKMIPTQAYSRTSVDAAISGTYKNTSFFYNGTSMDLDNMTADGFSPYGINMTFYLNCIGLVFNTGYGGYLYGNQYFQFRYPNNGPNIMTDIIANGNYCYVTYAANPSTQTIKIERYTANNKGLINYDFSVAYGYMDGKDCDFTWDCLDVASNRDDGKLIIRFTALSDPASFSDIWYLRYNINLTIVDEDGIPIEGAEISLIGDETSTDTTDVDGLAIVTQLGYTITCPEYRGNSTEYGVASDWKTADLTIIKEGYQTYIVKDIEIREGQDWTISLIKTKELSYTF